MLSTDLTHTNVQIETNTFFLLLLYAIHEVVMGSALSLKYELIFA